MSGLGNQNLQGSNDQLLFDKNQFKNNVNEIHQENPNVTMQGHQMFQNNHSAHLQNITMNAQQQNGVNEVIEEGNREEVLNSLNAVQNREAPIENDVVAQVQPEQQMIVPNASYNTISDLYKRLLTVDDGKDGKGKFAPMKNALFVLYMSWKSLSPKEADELGNNKAGIEAANALSRNRRIDAITKTREAAGAYLSSHKWVFFSRGKARRAMAQTIFNSMTLEQLNVDEKSDYDENDKRFRKQKALKQSKENDEFILDVIRSKSKQSNEIISKYSGLKRNMQELESDVAVDEDYVKIIDSDSLSIAKGIGDLSSLITKNEPNYINHVFFAMGEIEDEKLNNVLAKEQSKEKTERKFVSVDDIFNQLDELLTQKTEKQKVENVEKEQKNDVKVDIRKKVNGKYDALIKTYDTTLKNLDKEIKTKDVELAKIDAEIRRTDVEIDSIDDEIEKIDEALAGEKVLKEVERKKKETERTLRVDKRTEKANERKNKKGVRDSIANEIRSKKNTQEEIRKKREHLVRNYRSILLNVDKLDQVEELRNTIYSLHKDTSNSQINQDNGIFYTRQSLSDEQKIVATLEKEHSDYEFSAENTNSEEYYNKNIELWKKQYELFKVEIDKYDGLVKEYNESNNASIKNYTNFCFLIKKRTDYIKANDDFMKSCNDLENRFELYFYRQMGVDGKVADAIKNKFIELANENREKSDQLEAYATTIEQINPDSIVLSNLDKIKANFFGSEFGVNLGNQIVSGIRANAKNCKDTQKECFDNRSKMAKKLAPILIDNPTGLEKINGQNAKKLADKIKEKEAKIQEITKLQENKAPNLDKAIEEKTKIEDEIKKLVIPVAMEVIETHNAQDFIRFGKQQECEENVRKEKYKLRLYDDISKSDIMSSNEDNLQKVKQSISSIINPSEVQMLLDLSRKVDEKGISEQEYVVKDIKDMLEKTFERSEKVTDPVAAEVNNYEEVLKKLDSRINENLIVQNISKVIAIMLAKKRERLLNEYFPEVKAYEAQNQVNSAKNKQKNEPLEERLKLIKWMRELETRLEETPNAAFLVDIIGEMQTVEEQIKRVAKPKDTDETMYLYDTKSLQKYADLMGHIDAAKKSVKENRKKLDKVKLTIEIRNQIQENDIDSVTVSKGLQNSKIAEDSKTKLINKDVIQAIEDENSQILNIDYSNTNFTDMKAADISLWIKGFMMYNQIDSNEVAAIGDAVDALVSEFSDMRMTMQSNTIDAMEVFKGIDKKNGVIYQNANKLKTLVQNNTSPLYKHRDILAGLIDKVTSRNFINEIRRDFVESRGEREITDKNTLRRLEQQKNIILGNVRADNKYDLLEDAKDGIKRAELDTIVNELITKTIEEEKVNFVTRYEMIKRRKEEGSAELIDNISIMSASQLKYEYTYAKVDDITAHVLHLIGIDKELKDKLKDEELSIRITEQYRKYVRNIVKDKYVNPLQDGKWNMGTTGDMDKKEYQYESLVFLAEAYQNNPQKLVSTLVERNLFYEYFGSRLDAIKTISGSDKMTEKDKLAQIDLIKKDINKNLDTLLFYVPSTSNQFAIKQELIKEGGGIMRKVLENDEGYETNLYNFNINKRWWQFWKSSKKTAKYYRSED